MLNGYDTFVILTLVFLLLICFFILGYLYAKRHFMKFFMNFLKTHQPNGENPLKKPRDIKIREIKVDDKEKFEEMLRNIFENIPDDDEEEDDDETRDND